LTSMVPRALRPCRQALFRAPFRRSRVGAPVSVVRAGRRGPPPQTRKKRIAGQFLAN
jgi:hypothetical protein